MDTTELIIGGKFVELAELECDYANKNCSVHSYVVEHYGSFIDDSMRLQFNEFDSISSLTMQNKLETESKMRDLVNDIGEITDRFYENRENSVSFMDFLYYSICVSTSAGFGDIIPNNSLTRTLTIIELLSCIVLVTHILSNIKITNRNKDD